MQVEKTTLRDVWLIKPDFTTDFRGDYVMTYHKELYKSLGIDAELIEQDVSYSTKGVLKGIHYSPACWKLNECLYGAIYYVVVNCDTESTGYGEWQSFILSDKNHYQLFKHPRYGSGLYTLTDIAVFHYMQSEYYDPSKPHQQTFKWNDPRFMIWWPTNNPILSRRDDIGEYITD